MVTYTEVVQAANTKRVQAYDADEDEDEGWWGSKDDEEEEDEGKDWESDWDTDDAGWEDKDDEDYDEEGGWFNWGDKEDEEYEDEGEYSSKEVAEPEPYAISSLPSLNVDADTVTVFGYSCGSWTAHQIGTILSGSVKGQILCNGGVAFDGYSDVAAATTKVEGYDTASTRAVDDVTNLNGMPIYVYSGANDYVIPPNNQQEQIDFYDHFSANTTLVTEDVGHYFESDTFRNGLEWSYGDLISDWAGLADDSSDWSAVGTLIPIDQDEFWTVSDTYPDSVASGIADRGFLYYPDNCVGSSAACKLSIILPGGGGNVTEMFGSAGFLEVAAANDIVLLFAQQDLSGEMCFDLTAHTGDDYDTL